MFSSEKEALESLFGPKVRVEDRKRCFGGDINASFLLRLSDGNRVFVKENPGRKEEFFLAEAEGLVALSAMKVIRVPDVLAVGAQGGNAFLMLSVIHEGARRPDFWEEFGQRLALLHKQDASAYAKGEAFGFLSDNYIGATAQINTPKSTWVDFYRCCRLQPQFTMASRYFDETGRKHITYLMDHLGDWMEEPPFPSLLHGDLWNGNFMVDEKGEAVLIDPAVYVGSAEADLAMTELFGGFGRGFYAGYYGENPMRPGYEDRKPLYHLYHLLNHLNLFGGAYYGEVARILRRFGGS